jgi:8-oxo-dGTP pyrophosphatase MutT (NUDIX family)
MSEHEVAAATVVPLRDAPDGLEVLMLRKNSKLAFGGMWVFPGGRVDPADLVVGGSEVDAARRAAVREAVEEAAIVIDPDVLVPFSHWSPPLAAPRRYLTWFFLAPLREAVDVVIDMGEIHDHGWLSPAAALARRDEGEYELAPPTWMTLDRLASSGTVDAALSAASSVEPAHYVTRIASVDGGVACLWDGDAGYTTGDATLPGPRHRLIMDEIGGWRKEIS